MPEHQLSFLCFPANSASPKAKICLLPVADRPAIYRELGVGRRALNSKQNPSTNPSGIRQDKLGRHRQVTGCILSNS